MYADLQLPDEDLPVVFQLLAESAGFQALQEPRVLRIINQPSIFHLPIGHRGQLDLIAELQHPSVVFKQGVVCGCEFIDLSEVPLQLRVEDQGLSAMSQGSHAQLEVPLAFLSGEVVRSFFHQWEGDVVFLDEDVGVEQFRGSVLASFTARSSMAGRKLGRGTSLAMVSIILKVVLSSANSGEVLEEEC